MRELQVIGLDASGDNVLLQGTGTDDRFTVPADDRLRAAARGDLSRLGQIEVEADSSLRPREIQARIRLGATVADVAAEAGIPASRVERFAHPVLLERSNIADLGRGAHPVRPDGPAEQSLDEIIAAVFRARGLDADEAEWDAWRNKDAEWIVQLAWQAGRSENTAHWRLYKEGLGGTLTALDDSAAELIDPDVRRPLRPLISVGPADAPHFGVHGPEESALEPQEGAHAPQQLVADDGAGADDGASGSADGALVRTGAAGRPVGRAAGPTGAEVGCPTDTSMSPEVSTSDSAADGSATPPPVGAPDDSKADATTQLGTDDSAGGNVASAESAGERGDDDPQDALIPGPEPGRAASKRRRDKPTMPSWEDVLLGVRSTNG